MPEGTSDRRNRRQSIHRFTVPSNPHALTHVTTTFDLVSLTSAFKHKDVVISTISGGDVSFQKLLINTAIAAGVRRFIPNEFSHNTQNPRVCERFPHVKQEQRFCNIWRKRAESIKNSAGQGWQWVVLLRRGWKGVC